ncbi:DUF1501 domain-containing protein [Gynuella sunshinyii]|nr:DUF1501 domain-containing protein [Gynuella sunshinyii]
MKRRSFLKTAALGSSTVALPASFSLPFLANKAYAYSPTYANANISAPAVMPQVINIFLYGGASELAGNLTNMAQNGMGDTGTNNSINTNSKNSYSDGNAFGGNILLKRTDNPNGEITANGCWYSAGGAFMENMLSSADMNLYRTIYKQKSPTQSHRESIFMSHKGALDIENAPGVGTRLALMINSNFSSYKSTTFADGDPMPSDANGFVLPFVSFEGNSTSYALDPENTMPLNLRGITMDNQFNNPYTRGDLTSSETAINAMAQNVIASQQSQYNGVWSALNKRAELADRMTSLSALLSDDNLPVVPGGVNTSNDISLHSDFGHNLLSTDSRLQYPNTGFAQRLKAAVTLMLHNPQTLYATVGTDGLGGWDDHNNGIDRDGYRRRMLRVMQAIDVAMKHIKWAGRNGITTLGGKTRTNTSNIIINVMGDFGRRVNLNDSGGWDHGNNQNLYTFGGAGISSRRALGNVIGETIRAGQTGTNNQYTVPDNGSKTWEPMSVAASTYRYFGATNPHIMTADPTYNPQGDKTLEDES